MLFQGTLVLYARQPQKNVHPFLVLIHFYGLKLEKDEKIYFGCLPNRIRVPIVSANFSGDDLIFNYADKNCDKKKFHNLVGL